MVTFKGQPAPAEDVGVARGGVRAGQPHLHPVRPAGEKGRVHRVQGDVDPPHLGVGVQVGGLLGHGVFGGDLEAPDLSVREVGVAVLDRPPIEPFEDDDVVGDGVLLEGFAAGAGGAVLRAEMPW